MKTYTDDEIVRALGKIANEEIGDCARDCIFYNGKVCHCAGTVAKYSLYFIKRQQAEIERFKDNKKYIYQEITAFRTSIVKEFAERLKDVFVTIDGTFECWEIEERIDELAKEMTEENK